MPKVAQLAVGDRTFYLAPDDVATVMAAAVSARDSGQWLEFSDAGGNQVRVLFPSNSPIVIREYEVDEPEAGPDGNSWSRFDYDF